MYYMLLVLLFLNLFLTTICLSQCELSFVQILFRHGDRAPVRLYPNDPNPASLWPEGLGKLTMLGRKQHYVLGATFRQMYKDFITSSPLEVNVTSSEVDRCRKSAETNLASFFAPTPKWQFDSNVTWQPITIDYVPEDLDKYLETESHCPAAEKEYENVINSPGGQRFISEHKVLFNYLSLKSGSNIDNWESASYLHNAMSIEKKYNFTFPEWAEKVWDEMTNVTNYSFYWSFNSPLLLRLRAGPLIGLIIENMNKKISGQLHTQKVQIFSGHDTNIAVVLHTLGIFNMLQPPYCSSLLFELHECSGTHAVRILFFNSTTPEEGSQKPHVLRLNGCSEYCPLEFFVNLTKHIIPENWEKECDFEVSYFNSKIMLIATIASSVTLCFILVVYCLYAFRRKAKAKEYSYHLMTLD